MALFFSRSFLSLVLCCKWTSSEFEIPFKTGPFLLPLQLARVSVEITTRDFFSSALFFLSESRLYSLGARHPPSKKKGDWSRFLPYQTIKTRLSALRSYSYRRRPTRVKVPGRHYNWKARLTTKSTNWIVSNHFCCSVGRRLESFFHQALSLSTVRSGALSGNRRLT